MVDHTCMYVILHTIINPRRACAQGYCSRCVSVCLFVQETYLPTGASKRRTKGTSGTSGIHTWI